MNAIIDAMHDMKAAIRYLRNDAKNDNQYRIDSEKIFVGGVSAGAITALHTGLMDDNEIHDQFVQDILDENGGLKGLSGDESLLQVSSEVSGIFNLSGAVFRLDYLDADDPSIMSYHGNADEVVPYEYDFVNVFVDIIPVYGSKSIHDKAIEIGLTSTLLTVEGGDHTMIYTEEYQAQLLELDQVASTFFKEEICE
jgi:para-nitrobenzyl esterase